jgi:hypothetical protein
MVAKKKVKKKAKPESGRAHMYVPDPADVTKAVQVGPQPVDMADFEGTYYKKDEPYGSEGYSLQIDESDPYGHTHILKNQEHHWQGTKEQFDLLFSETAPKATEEEEY